MNFKCRLADSKAWDVITIFDFNCLQFWRPHYIDFDFKFPGVTSLDFWRLNYRTFLKKFCLSFFRHHFRKIGNRRKLF